VLAGALARRFRRESRSNSGLQSSTVQAVFLSQGGSKRSASSQREMLRQRVVRKAMSPCPEAVTSGDMPGRYDFNAVEEELYTWWEESGFFKPEIAEMVPKGPGSGEPYVIPMPPPNVTGRLHMGHAMFVSIEDALARFRRMYGHRTLWIPGTDHAGIATQMLVERQLVAEGSSRQEVGREQFLDRVWEWKADKGGAIVEQLRKLGASADWSREQFTLNENMSASVIEAFVRLHDMGLIYKGNRMVNWDPKLQTAMSDLEVEYSEQEGKLYHFKYVVAATDDSDKTDEFVPVATTRPETILGDTAVCVHPEDPRYQHLIGREVIVPIQGRRIPVIADAYVDMEFGTGALKITPAHDFNDFEISQRHDLDKISIMTQDGRINSEVVRLGSPQYEGMERFECRRQLWADMENEGLVLKEEPHMQRVPLSQRSGEVIEPLLSDQWFVNTEDMAQRAMDAVESGEIRIQPERYVKIWRGWLEEKQPWCISRQLWWGHRIPVYYVEEPAFTDKYFVARSEEEALAMARKELGDDVEIKLRQDTDVLDTWFSSGLWPFATLGWPNEDSADYKAYYPGHMMETGYDILFFWVARMVMMALTLTDKVPFKEIYLHGLVRDENNQKMSKTKGNVVDPLETIPEYGTDALRYSLLTSAVPGQDVPLSKGALDNAKSFANKIWNVGRFILSEYERTEGARKTSFTTGMPFAADDVKQAPWLERAMISKCHSLITNITDGLLDNKFDAPSKALSEFLWEDLANWYVEAAKTRLQDQFGGDPSSAEGETAQRVLLYSLEVSLKLLHPFMPFVTEAVWQRLPQPEGANPSLMIAAWPAFGEEGPLLDKQAEGWFTRLRTLITFIRNVRAEYGITPKERPALSIYCEDAEFLSALQSEGAVIAWLARVDAASLKVVPLAEKPAEAGEGMVRSVVTDGLEVDIFVPKKDIDYEKEAKRLEKQLANVTKQLAGQEKKITPAFLEKASEIAKEKTLAKAEELRQTKAAIEAQLNELKEVSQV